MRYAFLVSAIAALSVAGCANPRHQETAVGAGVGAATGAVLGGVMADNSGRGAATGAVVGGAIGAAAGYNWKAIKEKLSGATQGSGVAVKEQGDGSLKLDVPGSVSFDTGSAAITPGFHATLDKIAATLNEHRDTTVTVVGHSDSVGDAQYNMTLSAERARAVTEYLAARGVDRARMVSEGRGETQPVADNASEAGRAMNRRVEILLHAAVASR